MPLLTPLVELGLFDILKNRRKVLPIVPNLFVFADELGSLFADSNYSWTEAEDFSQAEKYEKEEAIIGVGLSTHPLVAIGQRVPTRSNQFLNSYKESRYAFSLRYKAFEPFEPSQVISWLSLQVSDTKKNWM